MVSTIKLNEETIQQLQRQAEAQGQSVDDLLGGLLAQQDGHVQPLGRFFELSRDLLSVLDAEGRFIQVNPAAERVLGYSPDTLQGQRLIDFVHADDRTAAEGALNLHLNGKVGDAWFEAWFRRQDGTYRWLSWSICPLDGDRAYASARDLTERKHKEDELIARNEELDAFAYSVAHDLKNPVASMLGFASLMHSYYDRMDQETLLYHVDEIVASGYQVREIVDALLLLSRVRQSDMPQTEPLDMYRIVEDVTDRIKAQIIESSAVINMPDHWPTAIGYQPWVEQVWMNYLTNAIKYGGTPPVIELGADAMENGMVRLWVRDNGQGLTEEQQASLFKPFSRMDKSRGDGHGLGLSIVQRIVHRLGGEVGVESIVGEGSKFSFTLPAA